MFHAPVSGTEADSILELDYKYCNRKDGLKVDISCNLLRHTMTDSS